jgi:hypothetical protein
MAELRIPIIVENKGKKALGDADKGVKNLSKSFKKLAGAAGIGLSTAAVIRFGKEAAKAFIADEKAANRLAMSVKNLGLGFEAPRIERYISELSAMSGVTDDQLRPAMQKLLQTTGSVAKAQELLSQATDIAAGSGVDYETVVNDLSMAYVGQTRGLRKYSLGLSVAELKTMKFSDVQDKLNKQFTGANAAYLTTYAGKMQLISTAAGEASEKIGGALVESLVSAFAAGDPQEFVAKIESLATKIASMVATAVFGFKKLYYLTSDQAILASLNPFDNYENDVVKIIDIQEKMFRASFEGIKMGYLGSMPIGIYSGATDDAARKKAEADALKRAKALAAVQSKTLAEAKKKTALDKASKTLDLESISLEAALRGKISETDRISLLLQKSILEGNATQASQLSAQLNEAVKRQNALSAALLATPEAPNPYRNWVAPSMGAAAMAGAAPSQGGGGVIPDFNVPANQFSQVGPMGGLGAGVIAGVNPNINITVELDGKTVTGAITESQVNQSLSGTFSDVSRYNGRGAPSIK